MLKNTIIVSFSAPEHSGKTILEAAFAKLLLSHGIAVTLPPDPQRESKMSMPMEDLLEQFKNKSVKVLLMESNAT
jgi:hypothetical protein